VDFRRSLARATRSAICSREADCFKDSKRALASSPKTGGVGRIGLATRTMWIFGGWRVKVKFYSKCLRSQAFCHGNPQVFHQNCHYFPRIRYVVIRMYGHEILRSIGVRKTLLEAVKAARIRSPSGDAPGALPLRPGRIPGGFGETSHSPNWGNSAAPRLIPEIISQFPEETRRPVTRDRSYRTPAGFVKYTIRQTFWWLGASARPPRVD
jgi:hypothetical protein